MDARIIVRPDRCLQNLTTKIFKRQVHNNIELGEQNWTPLTATKAFSSSMQPEPSELDKSTLSNNKLTDINSVVVMENSVKEISIQEHDQQVMWGSLNILTKIISHSSKMNELNVDKARSSCPIENRSDRDVEPKTLIFGSSSMKGKRSVRKGRDAIPTRPSVYSTQAAEL
ncbi:hypothetical protein ACFE04_017006 [Oxalis oulophora]